MIGRVAQWIEHLPSKQMVGSSILSSVIFCDQATFLSPVGLVSAIKTRILTWIALSGAAQNPLKVCNFMVFCKFLLYIGVVSRRILMRLTGKTICLLFLFILIFPLYAETSPEPQPDPIGEVSPPDEELLPDEENFIDEETILSEEILPDNETLAEAELLDEDTFFFEAPPLIFEVPVFEIRSLDTIFPNLSQRQKITAMGNNGLRNYFVKEESPVFIPNPDVGIDLLGSVMRKNPSHLIEALAVVPYNGRELDLLDIYNALGRIEKIKDQSVILNGNDFYVFTESTRIESSRNRRAVSDPTPAVTLPFSETMYLRLKEINLGNLFLRGDVSISMYGITYSMTNFVDVRYFLVPIVRAERFITILYLEPVREGILIYCVTGFYLPGFIADRVNLTPNINRRIRIFISWITDGLRTQENIAVR